MAKKDQRRGARKKNIGIAVIAWFVLALVIFVFFMIERKTIVGNLQDFFGKAFPSNSIEQSTSGQGEFEVPPEIEINTPENVTAPITITQSQTPSSSGIQNYPENNSQAGGNSAGEKYAQQTTPQIDTQGVPDASTTVPGTSEPIATQTSRTELCFVVIDGDGSVSRKLVMRDLPRSSAPLTAALNALLAGPTPAERNANCTSLIPSGTRLLGASVRDGVAYLNFSDEFEINTVGVEGYTAQMMQIVFTATNFSTVNSVQFLINGERKEYLGSEGLWIGSPLNRASFR